MILIIHHSADSDGLMSEAVCRYHLVNRGNEIQSIGWDYGQPVPKIPEGAFSAIYMVDVTVDGLLQRPEVRALTVLIDHHRTALEKWGPKRHEFLHFLVVEGFAACRLCWRYFSSLEPWATDSIAKTLRDLSEPRSIFLVGLRDVWQHIGTPHEDAAICLELGLRATLFDSVVFQRLLYDNIEYADELMQNGRIIRDYAERNAAELAARGAHLAHWQGLTFLCLNSQQRGTLALDARSKAVMATQPHDALMVWAVGADKTVNVSLYHADGHKDIDLSAFAKYFGGGGHTGACGFRIDPEAWLRCIKVI
jgi:hypothetical protein